MKRFEVQGGGYRRATYGADWATTGRGQRSRGDYSQMSAMVARRAILINLGANWLAPGSIHDQLHQTLTGRMGAKSFLRHRLSAGGRLKATNLSEEQIQPWTSPSGEGSGGYGI